LCLCCVSVVSLLCLCCLSVVSHRYGSGDPGDEGFTFQTGSSLNAQSVVTSTSYYDRSSFSLELPPNRGRAQNVLWKLRERKWIDLSTRAVLIDFNVMNLNYYSMATASVVSDDYCCFVRKDCCFVRRTVVLSETRIILSGRTVFVGTRIILSGRTAICQELLLLNHYCYSDDSWYLATISNAPPFAFLFVFPFLSLPGDQFLPRWPHRDIEQH
jgi:hypothetical protein